MHAILFHNKLVVLCDWGPRAGIVQQLHRIHELRLVIHFTHLSFCLIGISINIPQSYAFFSSQIIFSWPSWDNLFSASNKMRPYFKSVPLFPSSPASYALSLQQDLAYQWRISSFNKSLLLQSPFPLVFPAWLVDLTQLLFAGVFGVRVWSRLLGWMDSRSKMTKDALSHYGLRKCMQQRVWVMACKDVYVHGRTLEVNGLFLHAGRRECINAALYTSVHPQVGLRLSLYACDQSNKLLKRCPKPAGLLFLHHRLPLTLVGHGKK